jgi:predicted dehydrogenase
MVGYMKRYDPAYEQLLQRIDTSDLRLVRVTTLESPEQHYVTHYPRATSAFEPNGVARARKDDERRIIEALGIRDPVLLKAYGGPLLDSMVHELNAVRGVLGEPTELRFASIWGAPTGITATLAFGPVECVFMWVELPGIARYEQELAFYGSRTRLRLTFPSPFLRSMPTSLITDAGEVGTSRSWSTCETVSFEEAFKRELCEFHNAIIEEREPRTSGSDGMRDIALAAAIVRCHLEQSPIPFPTNAD